MMGIRWCLVTAVLSLNLMCGVSVGQSEFGVETESAPPQRQWTIFIAQDKHLDYNWCGSTTEIELRMAALLDYYVEQAEQGASRWNLDGTVWHDVYRRHRGEVGAKRLQEAIRKRQIGYAGNFAVLLWGILDTETAVRACYGAIPLEQTTGVPARTALVMENPGLTWGAASVLRQCGFDFLGRGVYRLRAESYLHKRNRYPLFWWQAQDGERILVHWDRYADTKSWGGYAEAHLLATMAGEKWDAFGMQSFGDRNTADVFQKRKSFVQKTIQRYEAYGDDYPISSILLLGTGWDNWTQTTDLADFVRKYNAESDGTVRLVDARYEEYFEAAEKEIREKDLHVPQLQGSFGICWEEWAAHVAGSTAEFREAQRLLRIAEAAEAVDTLKGHDQKKQRALLHYGVDQLLKFAEHDFGGVDRQRAAMSAGARANAVTQAMDIARSLVPADLQSNRTDKNELDKWVGRESVKFTWRGGTVVYDPRLCALQSLVDASGYEWVAEGRRLGAFVHSCYQSRAKKDAVFPALLASNTVPELQHLVCRRSQRGVQLQANFQQDGFQIESSWFFHKDAAAIDISYRVRDGWTDEPQSVEFSFPWHLEQPEYHYDGPAAILTAGPREAGGSDLPGANPELFAGLNFAAASNTQRTALLITPDQLLLRFGHTPAAVTSGALGDCSLVRSMPMMNLTGNDWQFGQGGQREWTYRYRVVLSDSAFDPVQAVCEANGLGTPPFLQVPGEPPVVAGLAELDIQFSGGPLLACKTAEDGQRVILRFWNVTDRLVAGSLKLPRDWHRAAMCDGLERKGDTLQVVDGRVQFRALPHGLVTIALLK